MKRKISRRHFLGDLGAGAMAPMFLGAAFDVILQGMVQRAFATPLTGGAAMNLISLHAYGSPPRWVFDLVLSQKGRALPPSIVDNLMVRTAYSGTGDYTSAVYRGHRYNASTAAGDFYHVPYLWSLPVSVDGQDVQADTLLQNAIFMRGIWGPVPSHFTAMRLHFQSLPTERSLHAQVGDLSHSVVKTLFLDGDTNFLFNSSKGYKPINHTTGTNSPTYNGLASIFGVFQGINSATMAPNAVANLAQFEAELRAAAKAIAASQTGFYRKAIEDEAKNTMDALFASGPSNFSGLATAWSTLFAKYRTAINSSLSINHPLIDDGTPIPYNAATTNRYRVDLLQNVPLFPSGNIRQMMANAHLDKMAAQFAISEFVVTNNLSQAVGIRLQGLQDVRVGAATNVLAFDQHSTGTMSGLLLNTKNYLAVTSCLLTLVKALKDQAVFDKTLIYYAGEFGRSPRVDGSGADHANRATNISLISGAIKKFEVVGNIHKDPNALVPAEVTATYKGSWGYGARTAGNDNNYIDLKLATSSVIKVLGGIIPTSVDSDKLVLSKTVDAAGATIAVADSYKNDNKVV